MQPKEVNAAPAIVFLHGSGPVTRKGFRSYAETFAQMGIASLFFDKRGAGKSTGAWANSSLDDLAEDIITAVSFLKGTAGIDTTRIGLWGVSQAGWVASKAIAESSDINFMIIISGGGASPRESELYSYRLQFERMGLSDQEIEKGLAIVNQFFLYLSGELDREELLEKIEDQKGTNLEFLSKQLLNILPSETNRKNWSWVSNYDPLGDIRKIKCPVLLMFGDKDRDQPTDIAIQKWKKGLNAANNQKFSIILFPGAAHGIRLAYDGDDHHRAPFADGYMEMQIGWLWLNVLNAGIEPVKKNAPSLQSH